jgi:hypothetical protein
LPLLDDVPHRLRRGALHLPIRRSRQNVNLFLRGPLPISIARRGEALSILISILRVSGNLKEVLL